MTGLPPGLRARCQRGSLADMRRKTHLEQDRSLAAVPERAGKAPVFSRVARATCSVSARGADTHARPGGYTDGKTGRTNLVGSCPRITGSSCHTSRYGGSAPELAAALRSAVDILGLRRPPLSRSSDDEGRGCCVMGGLPHLVADQSQDRRSSADGVNRAIVLVEKVSCWVNLTRASLARSVRRREISSRYHCLPTTMFCRSALKVSISSWSEYPASSS